MMRSLRARLMLWTVTLSGLALVVFGMISDRAYFANKLGAVDEWLRSVAPPALPPPAQERFWTRYAAVVQESAQRIGGTGVAVAVYGVDEGSGVYLGDWYGELEALRPALPPPEGQLEPPQEDGVRLPEPGQPWLQRGRREGGMGQGRMRRGPFPVWAEGAQREALFTLIEGASGASWRFALYQQPGYTVALGVPLDLVMDDVTRLRRAYFVGFPVALMVIGLGAWLVSARALRPIRRITALAASVSAKQLDRRIATAGEDKEFEELIEVFNRMLDRLEGSFAQATRFSADAAHELKTPLTILLGMLEAAVQEAEEGSEQQRQLGQMLEETERLRMIARKLLLLAQADSGRLPVRRERFALVELADSVVEEFFQETSGIRLAWRRKEAVSAEGDPALVAQILRNLFSNACKYRSRDLPEVVLSLYRSDERAVFEIENGCEPLKPEQRAVLFQRFARLDRSRSREVEGTGLGLSLSREFARAQGGELGLVELQAADRIAFRLQLPAAE